MPDPNAQMNFNQNNNLGIPPVNPTQEVNTMNLDGLNASNYIMPESIE